jgi:hypothetical protein
MRREEVTVSHDRLLLVHDVVIDTLLSGDSADVARLLGLDPDRVGGIMNRLRHLSCGDPSSTEHPSVRRDRYRIVFLDALRHLPTETALAIFDQEDLRQLVQRWAFFPDLLTDPSFLTLDELADVIEEFANHLKINRLSLVRRGVPETSLGASYPGMLLSYVYPTKLIYMEHQKRVEGPERASPRDRALKHLPAAKRATREHTYLWLQGEPSTGGQDMVVDEPYEEAVRIGNLDEQDAARVEDGRDSFLDLEITVLCALAKALRRGDAPKLWEESLNLLTEALPADDAAFYLRMDQRCYGYDIASDEENGKGYLPVFPGGLTNLLIFVGHCAKELTIHTMDRTKSRLPRVVLDDASFRSYFQAVGQPWQLELDQELDQFIALASQELAFWEAYQKRINKAIPGEFTVTLSMDVKQKFAASFERVMRVLEEEWTRNSTELSVTSPVLQPMLQLPASINPAPDPGNVFHKDEDIWTIRYAGTTVQLPVRLRGLDYLAYLLRHPGQAFEVQDLDSMIRGNLGPAPDADAVLALGEGDDGFRVGWIGDAGELTTKETIKILRGRQRELEAQLKIALASETTDAVSRIQTEHAAIKRYLRETVDHHGRPRKAADSKEKARINVRRLVGRAIEQIEQKHPALAAHLEISVRTGDFCIYDPVPGDRTPWTF